MDKTKLAKRLNISKSTLYNWEKEKPELVKLIGYGLQYENHVKSLEKYLIDIKHAGLNNKL